MEKPKTVIHKWDEKWISLAIKVMSVGGSAERVAKAINHTFKTKITRNAVIGRINRQRAAGDDRFDRLPPAETINGRPISFLLRAWEDGISSVEIANYYDIHRNTVGKKAAEYGLPPRPMDHHAKAAKAIRVAKREAQPGGFVHKAFKARDTFPNPEAIGVDLEELRHNQCRFVIGDGPYSFCGAAIEPGSGSSYCRVCYGVVYVPSQPKGVVKGRV